MFFPLVWWYLTATFLATNVSPIKVQRTSRTSRELSEDIKNSIVITPQFTGLDCEFEQGEDCLWTWDHDNFTGAVRPRQPLPGQNGFYAMTGEEVRKVYTATNKNFFGPDMDHNGAKDRQFLYLLGRSTSDVANVTDKRIISSLIRESGNNCSLQMHIHYQNIDGMVIEFGTQNAAKAYFPIKEIVFTKENKNDSSHNQWRILTIPYGRYIDPFSISIDVKRSRLSEIGSHIAVDNIRLVNCEPESSIPIDCSTTPSRNYVCPGGQGTPCLDGPSMLCDIKPDCPGGDDEEEDACHKMPREARCDFNEEDDFCGWRNPNLNVYNNIPSWKKKKGPSELRGVRGDLSNGNQGHYLYLDYDSGPMVTINHGATLVSPMFPPPPKYNSNLTSPYFRSCRIRLSYHLASTSTTRKPGPLDLVVHFVNESAGTKTNLRPISLTVNIPMGKNKEGWLRWEAHLPEEMQYRYYLSLIGSNSFGAKAELAVDDLSLSPQCFGLGVPEDVIGAWRYNMTDVELCQYYGRKDCSSTKKASGYHFSTCNIFGPLGPRHEDCNENYAGTPTNVDIGDHSKSSTESHSIGYVTGIQRWLVPATGIYTIIANGASGARGRENSAISKGDEIRALVRLNANETIFILVGQMGISFCKNDGQFYDEKGICSGSVRLKRSADSDTDIDIYNLLSRKSHKTFSQDESESFGTIIFTPNGKVNPPRRVVRSVSAVSQKSSDRGRYDSEPNTMAKIAKMLSKPSNDAVFKESLQYSVKDGPGQKEDDENDDLKMQNQHQRNSDEDHGLIHLSSNDLNHSNHTRLSQEETGPQQGGGGGGGATMIFRILSNGTVQPILIAAGGGGSSDQISNSTNSHDARGLLSPFLSIEELIGLVSNGDVDAGSGGGWNSSFSYPCNFSVVKDDIWRKKALLQATGFSMSDSWMGGFPCSRKSEQWGGFGGGGGGCHGGGGGGGYIGGKGGEDEFDSGEGGWSYYNPDAVLTILESYSEGEVPVLSKEDEASSRSRPKQLFKTTGHGKVFIMTPLLNDRACSTNCTASGATCVNLDPSMKKTQCVCPNGLLLDHINNKCEKDISVFFIVSVLGGSLVSLAVIGLISMFLYSQYQRKHMQLLRRKMMSGPVEGQLNRLRSMNFNVNVNGVTMSEYNPNYDFGGGSYPSQELREISRENLRLIKALGQGAFGEVYQGVYKKCANENVEIPVAVKTLPELSSNQAEMDFLMEALIMNKFKHPNIVHFIGVCFEKHPRFIVLELLPGGDLKTFLRDSRPKPDRSSPLVMRDLLLCAIDVAKGCEFLESNHFIHRDIAARNCLLTSKGPGRVVKIADFGMSRDIYRADYYRKGGKAMLPVKWMPPEAFLDGIFTSKTDVWSFGILLWEVMSLGYMPYPGRGNQEVMQLVTNGGRLEPPNYCPGPVYGLMCQCWHPIPEERPNFRTILERLGYCMQDPEVVMAPLPVCHRQTTSLENSRETSLSSGKGGGATTGSSADSASGFSLPVRPGNKGRPVPLKQRASTLTPDSPDTTITLTGASSSDYLVPLTGMPTRPAGKNGGDKQKGMSGRKDSRESIPESSPSDAPASDDEDSEMLPRRPSISLGAGEAETSFTCHPSTGGRRSGGYTSLALTDSISGTKSRQNKRRRPSGSSSAKKLQQRSLSRNSINQIPLGSSSSSTASNCEPTTNPRPPRSRLHSMSHPLETPIEPPKRTTSALPSKQIQEICPNGAPLVPPPPPIGYCDSSPSLRDDLSPILPPLPPLPDELKSGSENLPLDVSSLRAQHRYAVPYINMDSGNHSLQRPTVIANPTPYVIHASSSPSSSTTSNRPKVVEPPSEISV